MTTAVDYKFNEEERQILSEMILYALGKIDLRIQQGEAAPLYADRRSLAEMLLSLKESGNVNFRDSEQITLDRLMEMFYCERDSTKHLIDSGWTSNDDFGPSFILSRYKISHIIKLCWKIYSGKPVITSMIFFGKDE